MYFKRRRHQLVISHIKFTGDALAETVNGLFRSSNHQLMPSELKIQYCYLHSNETGRKKLKHVFKICHISSALARTFHSTNYQLMPRKLVTSHVFSSSLAKYYDRV